MFRIPLKLGKNNEVIDSGSEFGGGTTDRNLHSRRSLDELAENSIFKQQNQPADEERSNLSFQENEIQVALNQGHESGRLGQWGRQECWEDKENVNWENRNIYENYLAEKISARTKNSNALDEIFNNIPRAAKKEALQSSSLKKKRRKSRQSILKQSQDFLSGQNSEREDWPISNGNQGELEKVVAELRQNLRPFAEEGNENLDLDGKNLLQESNLIQLLRQINKIAVQGNNKLTQQEKELQKLNQQLSQSKSQIEYLEGQKAQAKESLELASMNYQYELNKKEGECKQLNKDFQEKLQLVKQSQSQNLQLLEANQTKVIESNAQLIKQNQLLVDKLKRGKAKYDALVIKCKAHKREENLARDKISAIMQDIAQNSL